MKRVLLATLALALALPAFAQFGPPKPGTVTQVWNFKPAAAPTVSDAGWGKMYLDASCGCLKWSYNGGAYANLYTPGLAFVASFNGRTQAVIPASGDYTAAQVTVSPAIAAQTTVQASLANLDGRATTNANAIASLDTLKAPIASPTFTGTVGGVTKAMVGLSAVDNTSDANKPISTLTQSALDLKAPLANPAFTGTVGIGSNWQLQSVSTGTVERLTLKAVGAANAAELFLHPTGAATTSRLTISDNSNATNYSGIAVQSTATETTIESVKAGSGTAKPLKIKMDGTTALTVATNGLVTIGNGVALGATTITATGAEINHLSGVTSAIQTQLNAKSPIASPTFTGVPAAPTAVVDTNTTQIATTAYVVAQAYLKSATAASTYLTQANAASTYAPIANPTFTGLVTAPAITGASNVLEIRNGANPQTIYIYNKTGTDYERVAQTWIANFFYLRAQAGGTGVVRDVVIDSGSSTFFQTAGLTRYILGTNDVRPQTTNTYDFGTTVNRWRSGFFATSLDVTGALGGNPGLTVRGSGATDYAHIILNSGDGTTSNRQSYVESRTVETSPKVWRAGMNGNQAWSVYDTGGSRTPLSISATDGLVTLANGLDASGGDLRVKGGKAQALSLMLTKEGGVVKHKITRSFSTASLGVFTDRVTGASVTLTATPAIDTVVGFAAGVGLASGVVVFDTAAQNTSGLDEIDIAVVETQTVGVALSAILGQNSRNIAGVTRVRPEINLVNSVTGAAVNPATVLGEGQVIWIRYFGFIK